MADPRLQWRDLVQPDLSAASAAVARANQAFHRGIDTARTSIEAYQEGQQERADQAILGDLAGLSSEQEFDAWLEGGGLNNSNISAGMREHILGLRGNLLSMDGTRANQARAAAGALAGGGSGGGGGSRGGGGGGGSRGRSGTDASAEAIMAEILYGAGGVTYDDSPGASAPPVDDPIAAAAGAVETGGVAPIAPPVTEAPAPVSAPAPSGGGGLSFSGSAPASGAVEPLLRFSPEVTGGGGSTNIAGGAGEDDLGLTNIQLMSGTLPDQGGSGTPGFIPARRPGDPIQGGAAANFVANDFYTANTPETFIMPGDLGPRPVGQPVESAAPQPAVDVPEAELIAQEAMQALLNTPDPVVEVPTVPVDADGNATGPMPPPRLDAPLTREQPLEEAIAALSAPAAQAQAGQPVVPETPNQEPQADAMIAQAAQAASGGDPVMAETIATVTGTGGAEETARALEQESAQPAGQAVAAEDVAFDFIPLPPREFPGPYSMAEQGFARGIRDTEMLNQLRIAGTARYEENMRLYEERVSEVRANNLASIFAAAQNNLNLTNPQQTINWVVNQAQMSGQYSPAELMEFERTAAGYFSQDYVRDRIAPPVPEDARVATALDTAFDLGESALEGSNLGRIQSRAADIGGNYVDEVVRTFGLGRDDPNAPTFGRDAAGNFSRLRVQQFIEGYAERLGVEPAVVAATMMEEGVFDRDPGDAGFFDPIDFTRNTLERRFDFDRIQQTLQNFQGDNSSLANAFQDFGQDQASMTELRRDAEQIQRGIRDLESQQVRVALVYGENSPQWERLEAQINQELSRMGQILQQIQNPRRS